MLWTLGQLLKKTENIVFMWASEFCRRLNRLAGFIYYESLDVDQRARLRNPAEGVGGGSRAHARATPGRLLPARVPVPTARPRPSRPGPRRQAVG